MRLLAVSDLHGDLDKARLAIDSFAPDALLCCGDWGDPDQVSQRHMELLLDRLPILSTFGNHDPIDLLRSLQNRDGSPVLLDDQPVHVYRGLRLAAIGGIWAKNPRKRHHVTDQEVAARANHIASFGAVDILLTHGCPAGHADLMRTGLRGGQRCFLDAFHTIGPQLHLCGHLHLAQERILTNGRRVVNVGSSANGDVVLIEMRDGALLVRREFLARQPHHPQPSTLDQT